VQYVNLSQNQKWKRLAHHLSLLGKTVYGWFHDVVAVTSATLGLVTVARAWNTVAARSLHLEEAISKSPSRC
jgi:hypothetical protein